MTTRARILGFGATAVLVAAGAVSLAVFPNLTGELLMIGLVLTGFGGALLLVFLEVGLSEDRDRAEQERSRRARAEQRGAGDQRRPRQPRPPRRPGWR